MGEDTTDPLSKLSSVSKHKPETELVVTEGFVVQGDGSDPLPSFSQQLLNHPQNTFAVQLDMAQPQVPSRSGAYNMTNLANVLPPQANYRHAPYNGSQTRYNPATSSPGLVAQTQSLPPFNGQPGVAPMVNQAYYIQQQPPQQQPQHIPQYYTTQMSPAQPQANIPMRMNMPYYGHQIMANPQANPHLGYYFTQAPPFGAQGHPGHQGAPGPYLASSGMQQDLKHGSGDSGDSSSFSPIQQELRQSSSDSQSNVVRGPPRKPRQSGHAIWIGNLPSQTDLMSLVHHVCKEAQGLESLFLISKSNCAFANYKDEVSCLAAQQKLHESKFQSVRLVSRLRKNTVEGVSGITAPTGPSAATSSQQSPVPEVVKGRELRKLSDAAVDKDNAEDVKSTEYADAKIPTDVDPVQKDKFFVLKSLTVEDLELSVRTGIWATQSHNEQALNSAFKTSENVYLVFSANKSGEYFGYARMTSTINEDPAAAIEFAPKAQTVSDVDLPREIPTEATDTTPRGRIIDDSARGTIFWEMIREDSEEGTEQDEATPVVSEHDDSSVGADGNPENRACGKPFKLEWLCTTRLPFYRCRGLRNPWNSNREVKIARDGTELEPSVGRRLIGLFNRNLNSAVSRGPVIGLDPMMSPAQPMPMGYLRPFA